ncbi:unnamed protein product [Phytophthora fragariaefolia]|uniref:Unnamed protein product n=1 Tax=Phytophthora fragariaefolia TaxID=1490495 RepID=A0A9W6TGL6_9STRA|nr:unnamed protein product [Phytophthora fragariaefolia]
MVAGTGKTPRHTLTYYERKKILESVRRERCIRRNEKKEQQNNAAAQTPRPQASTKNGEAAALTTNKATAKSQAKARSRTTARSQATVGKQAAAEGRAVADGQVVVGHEPSKGRAPAESHVAGGVSVSKKKRAPGKRMSRWAMHQDKRNALGPPARASLQPSIVEEVVADIVRRVATDEAMTPEQSNVSVSIIHQPPARAAGKGKRAASKATRKRRRGVLQEESDGESGGDSSGDVGAQAAPDVQVHIACVVDGDANMMDGGADQCTALNYDEESDVEEEPEDEYGDDEFVEDWSIGYLTNEDSDVEAGDLPESVCLTAAKNKKVMSMMKTNGWEYDKLC